MNRQHLIGQARFDTTVVSRIEARQQASLDEFVKTELLQVIDGVFDDIERNGDGVNLSLERLEIDLGEIGWRDYRQQMPQRLRRQLRQALDNARYTGANEAAGGAGKIARGEARASPLWHFLLHGYLPSNVAAADAAMLNEMLRLELDQRPEGLVESIRTSVRRGSIVERIEAQFSAELAARLRRRLDLPPPLAGDDRKPPGVQPQRATDTAASDTDSAPLEATGDARDTQRMATAALPSTSASGAGQAPATDEPRPAPTASALARGALEADLETALAGGEPSLPERLWRELVRSDAATLRAILRRLGRRAQLRRALAQRLPQARFDELTALLEPVYYRVLLSVLEPGHWLSALVAEPAGGVAISTRLREWILGYLLIEPDQRFDRQEFIASLLLQAAEEYAATAGRSWEDFARIIDAAALTGRPPRATAAPPAVLFPAGPQSASTFEAADEATDVSADAPADVPADAPADAPADEPVDELVDEPLDEPLDGPVDGSVDEPARELARAALAQLTQLQDETGLDTADSYRRYTRLETLFSPGVRPPGEAQALADLEWLSARAPWLLMRLLRELQTDDDGWRRALPRLSETLLRQLGFRLLSIIDRGAASAGAADVVSLRSAIERHAARAQDRRAYHAQILARLIDGEPLDFEQLVAAKITPPDAGQTSGRAESMPGPEPVDPGYGDADTGLLPADPRCAQLILYAELLTTASLAAGLRLTARQLQVIKWRVVKTYLRDTGRLVGADWVLRGFFEALSQQVPVRADSHKFYSMLGQALVQNSLPSTRVATRRLLEALERAAGEAVSQPGSDADDARSAETLEQGRPGDDPAPAEEIHVDNAGLVLLGPWLPRLFEQLGLVRESEFIGREHAERAVHCLQFLVDSSLSSPEYRLVLNKLLCGVRPGRPIRRAIELSDGEIAQLEDLLGAVTQHWKALENTSIDGLRESFLQRGGRLRRQAETWRLSIEARPFDMLLDQVPWSYSTIKYAWMERVIYVDWR